MSGQTSPESRKLAWGMIGRRRTVVPSDAPSRNQALFHPLSSGGLDPAHRLGAPECLGANLAILIQRAASQDCEAVEQLREFWKGRIGDYLRHHMGQTVQPRQIDDIMDAAVVAIQNGTVCEPGRLLSFICATVRSLVAETMGITSCSQASHLARNSSAELVRPCLPTGSVSTLRSACQSLGHLSTDRRRTLLQYYLHRQLRNGDMKGPELGGPEAVNSLPIMPATDEDGEETVPRKEAHSICSLRRASGM